MVPPSKPGHAPHATPLLLVVGVASARKKLVLRNHQVSGYGVKKGLKVIMQAMWLMVARSPTSGHSPSCEYLGMSSYGPRIHFLSIERRLEHQKARPPCPCPPAQVVATGFDASCHLAPLLCVVVPEINHHAFFLAGI